MTPRWIAAVGLVLVAAATVVVVLQSGESAPPPPSEPSPDAEATPTAQPTDDRPLPKKAYLRAACGLPAEWVERIYRGWKPGSARDDDLVLVPTPPNYMGTFINTSHSAAYDFLQEVPLVLYGPGLIKPTGPTRLEGEVTIADLAPTFAELMDFEGWPDRKPSRSLSEILEATDEKPKLIVTAVMDGGGWNALEQWPGAWPNIERLADEGASLEGAIVGSSPSITPATHTNLSTGTFPRQHGVSAIAVRADDGAIVGSFSESAGNPGARMMDPRISLRRTTIADEWDRANGNRPKIGMLGSGNLQLGMIGFGAALRGGDKDFAVMKSGEGWITNEEFYSLPSYVNEEVAGPEDDIESVDRSDGEADGKWLGHEIPVDGSPAFAPWENRTMQAVLEREGFGDDSVTDLFYVNYKAPDRAGHLYNMIAPEQREVIASVDAAIGDMVAWLDDNVGRGGYVMVVTADHGQTPLEAGGWPIARDEIVSDINATFAPEGQSVLQRTSASSFFMRSEEIDAFGTSPGEIASYLSRYRIKDNIPPGGSVPEGFQNRLNERIFDAVFPGSKLDAIVDCTGAFGTK